eukprot:c17415_g1_i3.p1 GENE.c17415_g1_i3~~c17415_g1_i3.p1  ORF type:complete len:162 (+),score=35.76 c17415_g1_i3:32-517(+)
MLTAIKQGNEAVVRSSLEINPELIHQSAQYGMTPLMNASMLGQTNILKVLIEYGADLNVKGKGGMTALMYAAFQNHVEVVQLLIASGADVTIRSDKNRTALGLAKDNGKTKVVEVIKKMIQDRVQAFLLGTHGRLGRSSCVQTLPIDMLEMILLQVTNESI